MSSNRRPLEAVARQMNKLVYRHYENCLFVSQYTDAEDASRASVFIQMRKEPSWTKEEATKNAYLELRRLLKALEYRIGESTEFSLKTELKMKRGR